MDGYISSEKILQHFTLNNFCHVKKMQQSMLHFIALFVLLLLVTLAKTVALAWYKKQINKFCPIHFHGRQQKWM
ncbi:hypothetical protein BpHYR1_019049 [Brachionus plicatilis]|uniref:Uncharacterized protein n=1 Tax=Brachionus plicatilis TaxID=10195 RepID=A0A3M7P4F7_BRAPC|nr:hypothetical protein BpHYR1_019049 [Brachionus plicatilis]